MYFVTGTDTDVGKTVVSAALLENINKAGKTTAGLKPISAGCARSAEGLRNDDALALQRASSLPLAYEDVNPIAFEDPVAPHLAAARLGQTIDMTSLVAAVTRLQQHQPDVLLVEGAGGWRLPLDGKNAYLSALPQHFNMPVILVVGLKLGCLNHAMLTVEAIKQDGLTLAGWVANHVDPDMLYQQDNIQMLTHAIDAPCLGEVPFLAEPRQATRHLQVQHLLG